MADYIRSEVCPLEDRLELHAVFQLIQPRVLLDYRDDLEGEVDVL